MIAETCIYTAFEVAFLMISIKNILRDIGCFDEKKIRDIVFELSIEMKLLIAVTPFNILEIEKIPNETVKTHIHYFLNLSNSIFLKGIDDLFADEIEAYRTGATVNPMQFITTFISKSQNGKSANYLSVLENLRGNMEYQKVLADHYAIINKQQENFQQKPNVFEEIFTEILFREHLKKTYSDLEKNYSRKIANCCPSYMAYAYSLYDKIGSKSLRKKAGEMNDTAMSYIFPYVRIVVTEKRQASIFNRAKNGLKIPALNDTIILKYSDVFIDGEFRFRKALNMQEH